MLYGSDSCVIVCISDKGVLFGLSQTCTVTGLNIPGRYSAIFIKKDNIIIMRLSVTLSVPNFRRQCHLFVCFFFYFNKLSLGKTFIRKVDRLTAKQRRSR